MHLKIYGSDNRNWMKNYFHSTKRGINEIVNSKCTHSNIVIHKFWYRHGIQTEKERQPNRKNINATVKKFIKNWIATYLYISLHNYKQRLRCSVQSANCQSAPTTLESLLLSAVTVDWNSIFIMAVYRFRLAFFTARLITRNARTRSQCQIYC